APSLPLDHAERPQLRHRARDAGAFARVDDIPDVLVGFGDLLLHRADAVAAHDDTPVGELAMDVATFRRLLGLTAAERAAGTVAGTSERLLHGTLRADEHVRVAAHVARNQHGLAHGPIPRGDVIAAGAEGPRGTLSMDTDLGLVPVDAVSLDLRNVVRDLVHGPQPDLR